MSYQRANLGKTGRILLVSSGLGLALAAGVTNPAVAHQGPASSPQQISNARANPGGGKSGDTNASSGDESGDDDSADDNGADDNADDNSGEGSECRSSDACLPVNNPPPVVIVNNPPPVVNNPPPVVTVDNPPPAVTVPKVAPALVNLPKVAPALVNLPKVAPALVNLPKVAPARVTSGKVRSTVVAQPAALRVTNPIPTSAAAGEADTSGQLVAGGLTAFAGFLVLGTAFVLRRREGDA